MQDAISFVLPLSDGLTGEKSVEVPQSLHIEGKESYTREEAIQNGMTINFEADSNSAVPVAIQNEQHEQRLLEDRAKYNGAIQLTETDETLYTLTAESLREKSVAEKQGLTQAISFYEPTALSTLPVATINQHMDAGSTALHEGIVPIRKKPVMAMPSEVLPSSVEIYAGRIDDNIGKSRSQTLKNEAALYREIVNTFKLALHKKVLYCFDEVLRYYKRAEDIDIKIMISQKHGDYILDNCRLDKTYNSICNMLRAEHKLVVSETTTSSPIYWPFLNGIVDINSEQRVFPNDGSYFNRYCLQCDFDPAADCPQFCQLIDSIAGGNPDIVQLLWEVIGYILSPDKNAKAFFVFAGVPNSGKSLLSQILCDMIGGNISATNPKNFDDKFGLQNLEDKHLNVCMDLPNKPVNKDNVAKIKESTGGDPMLFEAKYKNSKTAYNGAKLLFGTNFAVVAEDNDPAFYDRLVSIPFRIEVPKEHRNPNLRQMLSAEFSGIANIAMRYYLYLRGRNLQFSKLPNTGTGLVNNAEVATLVNNTRAATKEDLLEIFEFTGDPQDVLLSEEAFVDFCTYCDQHLLVHGTRDEFSRWMGVLVGTDNKKKVKRGQQSLQAFLGVRQKQ